MHRRLVTAAAWTLATLAAVTLSWFGVHTVLSNTAYPQRTLPLSDAGQKPGDGDGAGSKLPEGTSRAPSQDDSASSRGPSSGTSAGRTPSPSKKSDSPRPSTTSAAAGPTKSSGGKVKTYSVSGGRVSFAIDSERCEFVSATPNSGWAMQTWKDPSWIRVDFTQGDRRNMVFCRWDESGAPSVETDENAQ